MGKKTEVGFQLELLTEARLFLLYIFHHADRSCNSLLAPSALSVPLAAIVLLYSGFKVNLSLVMD